MSNLGCYNLRIHPDSRIGQFSKCLNYFMRSIAVIKEYTEIIRFCSIDYLAHKGPEPYNLDDPPFQFVADYQVKA